MHWKKEKEMLTLHTWEPIKSRHGEYVIAFKCQNCGACAGRRGCDRTDRPEPEWLEVTGITEYCGGYLDKVKL